MPVGILAVAGLAVVALRDGTLTIQLDTRPRVAESTGAVTGGTGATDTLTRSS
jgi:hypothetical protein